MTLHLVRLGLDARALAAFAVANGASDDDGGYALHLAIRRRFGDAGPQPFRLMEARGGEPFLLGYAADPGALEAVAALPPLDPLVAGVFPSAPDIRSMPAEWRSGQRLGFEVRARPVVRYGGRVRAARAERPGAWQNRAGEVDAFVAACERAGEGAPVDRGEVYRAWLARRLEGAADLEGATDLKLLRRVRTRRSTHGKPGPGRVEGPDAVMAGTLAVADPAVFARLLARGVGRHTAFGFGMLLLSPPGRAG